MNEVSTLYVSGSVLAPQICIICRKTKTAPCGSGYENISKFVTEDAANTLKEYADGYVDGEIKTQIQCFSPLEIIAKEFCYHRTCFRNIGRKTKEISTDHLKKRECLSRLKEYVDEIIFQKGWVVKVSNLTKFYEKCQKEIGIPVRGAENRHVKLHLVNIYGEKLLFYQKEIGLPELAYSATGPVEQNENSDFLMLTEVEKVKKVALIVKDELKEYESCFSTWPPSDKDLNRDTVIPKLLKVFLQTLLTKSNDASDRVQRLVKSIGEDIIYNSSKGRIKTAKHLQLGLFTKRKTGSKLLITCLNRLGHSMSYEEVNYVETYFAELQINQQNLRRYVPFNIKPNVFVTYVYDNCDHNPESLFGETMHCTNGIMIQETTDGVKTNPLPMRSVDIASDYFDELLSKQADNLWALARYISVKEDNEQQLPGWSGFHSLSSPKEESGIHTITYLPAINKSPTKLDTVQEVLFQVREKSETLGLKSADLVLDHAIYSKALEILTQPENRELHDFINLRMGGFHATCIFIAVIGKRFGLAGLKDLLVETNIVGTNSIDLVLKGKQYNRAIRALKTVYEALQRVKINTFLEWLSSIGKSDVFKDFQESNEMKALLTSQDRPILDKATIKFHNLFQLIDQFDQKIVDGEFGTMAMFWQSFVDMVQVLLDFIKSMRMRDWDLHLQSMRRMLPWFHAYDHVNYSRHLTYCWASQKNLHDNHPEIYEEFKRGNFSVKRSNGKFNALPPDQVIEQTINREQKGPGGIIGISTSIAAKQRWVLTSHITAQLSLNFKSSLSLSQENQPPKDTGSKRQKFDETLVTSCIEMINQWNNPFEPSEGIVNLSSGVTASEEIKEDLLKAKEIGERCLDEFLKSRIESGEVSLYEPIRKQKLKTFDNATKKKVLKVKGTDVAVKADRQTFARLLLIQQQRGIDLKKVLTYELSSLPLSLANPDGTLCKTAKSKLISILHPSIPQIQTLPNNSTAKIFDGMVLLQKIPPNLETFGYISGYLIRKIMKDSKNATFFVTDHYLPNSIKSMERKKRSNGGTLRIKVTRRDQARPTQLRKFFSNADNKLDLIKFLLEDWQTNPEFIPVLQGKQLFVTLKDQAYRITTSNNSLMIIDIPELQSQQEEADTKIFLCCFYASNIGFNTVHIITVDTDVLVLALYYQRKLDLAIIVEMGSGANIIIYDVSSHTFDARIVEALPSFHALSGCDSTSSFNGIGKLKALKTLKTDDRFIDAVCSIGEELDLSADVSEVLEEYVCQLYGEKNERVINNCRFKIFAKKKIPTPERLPPTKDALLLHFRRANYQSYEWKRALDKDCNLVDPAGKTMLFIGVIFIRNTYL